MATVLPIDKIDGRGGGKARGLALLKQWGMPVPLSWVATEYHSEDIRSFVKKLPEGIEYAVRSSASGEDGEALSFAGQFSSFLNLKGEDDILSAIDKCFKSAEAQNVNIYRKELHSDNGTVMHVIIQEMIHPVYSGVLFTADPVSNRRDKIMISVVKGIGEGLMAGVETGENITVYKNAKDEAHSKMLSEGHLRTLINSALEIEKRYGKPADLEWAIDKKGRLYWLQLRPVTGLKPVHINELDDTPNYDKPIYTRGNVGEMMPGPVTPLTLSTFVRAIDRGLQRFYMKTGAVKEVVDKNLFIHSFYNHLFFDVNSLYLFIPRVLMSRKENIDYSVVSQEVPGVEIHEKSDIFTRTINFIKMIRYLGGGAKATEALRQLAGSFRIDCPDDLQLCYDNIDKQMPVLYRAWDLHYVSSSQSGSYYTTILNIYAKGKKPGRAHQEKAARHFTDIPDIESAQVLEAIDELAGLLAKHGHAEGDFLKADMEKALTFLRETGPEDIRSAWSEFIRRHGHRGVREAEMREKEWAVDPSSIVEGIRSKVILIKKNAALQRPMKAKEEVDISKEDLNFIQKKVLKRMIPKARAAVARREQTKAMAIEVQYRFKLAYRHLARLLVRDGLLDDEDQIFFMKHEEIGKLIQEGDAAYWKDICSQRREIYPEMQKLIFPELVFGIPVPMELTDNAQDGALTGIPVSRGIVEGKVRKITTMAEASELQPGEIMVVEFTDIGWTPFYSIAGGLITEIGSPLSHGAVVAREYGLPTIVSVKGAMKKLHNSHIIRLDAFEGRVEIL